MIPQVPLPEPYQQPVEIQQQWTEFADQAAENQRRRQEIGYQINDYPQQTTSQPK